MRAKIVIPVVALAIVILLPAIWVHSHNDIPPVPPPTPAPAIVPAEEPPKVHRIAQPAPPIHSEAPANETEQEHDDRVVNRVAELEQMAVNADPAQLHEILSELSNPEAEIRQAAIRAAVSVGSKDAIPVLQDAIGRTEDPREKVELQDAIDYLNLPSILDQTNSVAPTGAGDSAPP